MRNILIILFLLNSTLTINAQIIFEKGYFIDNSDKRVECLIRNLDWKNNPSGFDYKLPGSDQVESTEIESVKEFGIYDVSKYVRADVNIDRSSNEISKMSTERAPIFVEEKLFLKVLVEGNSSLFRYQDGNLVRFFYKKDGNAQIEQLVYKKYKMDDRIAENPLFQQQLSMMEKCDKLNFSDIQRVKYDVTPLVSYFIKHNECSNGEYRSFVTRKKVDEFFNITIRPGVRLSGLSINNYVSPGLQTDFGNKVGFRMGIEMEFIFPFNKNKWSMTLEPTYQDFNTESVSGNEAMSDYTSIEFPLGVRHYFFLTNNSKLFANASVIYDVALNSGIDVKSGVDLEIASGGLNYAFGIGYKVKNRFSVELRHETPRNVLNYTYWSSKYTTAALILGYRML